MIIITTDLLTVHNSFCFLFCNILIQLNNRIFLHKDHKILEQNKLFLTSFSSLRQRFDVWWAVPKGCLSGSVKVHVLNPGCVVCACLAFLTWIYGQNFTSPSLTAATKTRQQNQKPKAKFMMSHNIAMISVH